MKMKARKLTIVTLALLMAITAGQIFQPTVLKAETVAAPSLQVVNINKADAEALQNIRGIGPALAKRIVDHRSEFGPFKSADDLAKVRGIGEAKLQKMKNQIAVS